MRRFACLLAIAACAAAAQIYKVPASPGWFPEDAGGLSRVLDDSFHEAELRIGKIPPRPHLLAVISPHAALPFSGSVAAAAYSRLDRPKDIILLAFNHQKRIEGVVAPDLDRYSTPLGDITVNRDALKALRFRMEPNAAITDHSLDNQLPFVQRAAPGVPVIPLYVGELTDTELASAAGRLVMRLKAGDTIVVSSDLTHYGAAYQYTPFPNDAQTGTRLRQRALELFDRIGSLDVTEFDRFISETHDTTCGWMPIRLLMATLARWSEEVYMTPVDYRNSGDRTHEYSLAVSYGALAFYPVSAYGVSAPNRAKLLGSARQTLEVLLKTGKKEPVPIAGDDRDAETSQRGAAFVTIRKKGELRGCIGTFTPSMPLWETIPDRTLAAATEDPRFPALSAAEGPVSLEISLLTPLRRLASWRDFRLGHGALIMLGDNAGTLLPQVAEEMHWTREQFLQNLAMKAGLSTQAYRDPHAIIYTYAAQVFAERPPVAQ